jgi:hypothetical protein
MRYLIGIAIGLVIVFNWTTIKSYFDKKIDEQSSASPASPQAQAISPAQEPAKKVVDESGAKQDAFKEFK